MERILRAPLLDRSARGVELTEFGRLLVERARVVFDEIRQGVSDIEHLSDPTRGTVRIGATEPVTGIVSQIIGGLTRKYPRISHDVIISDLDTLLDALRQRTRDVVVTRWTPPPGADDLAVQELFKSPLAVMAARTHSLLRRKKLSLGDLMDEKWTLAPSGSFLGRVVADLFHRRQLPLPPTVVTSMSVNMRLSLVASGGFLTVLPRLMLRYPSHRAWLRALDIDLNDSSQPIVYITLKRRRSGGALKLFEQATIDACRTIQEPQ
jgi:DNA-binding transcriptional LysR family regulator